MQITVGECVYDCVREREIEGECVFVSVRFKVQLFIFDLHNKLDT